MHDRQRIREAVRARLEDQVGTLVSGVYAGRAGGLVVSEGQAIFVDAEGAKSEEFDQEDYSEVNDYPVFVVVVGDGPEPDLADGQVACQDALDDVVLPVRQALKKGWVLDDQLVLPGHDGKANRISQWTFVGEKLVFQPGGRGQVAHNTLTYLASVVTPDGDPSYA